MKQICYTFGTSILGWYHIFFWCLAIVYMKNLHYNLCTLLCSNLVHWLNLWPGFCDFFAVSCWKVSWGQDTLYKKFCLISVVNFKYILLPYCLCMTFTVMGSQFYFEWHDRCTLRVHSFFVVFSVSFFLLFLVRFLFLLKDFGHKVQHFLPE